MVGVFDDLVIVRVADGSVVLDLRTGERLARVGKALSDCAGSARLIACDTSVEAQGVQRAGAVLTLRATEDGVRVRELRGTRSTEVNGVHQGRIFLDGDPESGYRSVDQNGVAVDDDLPGRFSGMSDQGYVLFTSGTPQADVAWDVYRRRGGS